MACATAAVPPAIPVLPGVLRLLPPAGDRGVLMATRCAECGATSLGLCRYCPNCTSSRVTALDCAGRGTLVNYTVVRRAASSWTGQVPYALGQVALPEGVEVCAEIVDCAHDDIRVGMPMELALRVGGNDAAGHPIMVYKWTPCAA